MISPLTLLLSAAALTASTLAATNSDFEPFEITNLSITKVQNANITLIFTVHDPDPLAASQSTQACSGTWKINSHGYPVDSYQICGNTTFGWNMESYTTMEQFVLQLEHSYTDPSVGEPPYDQITNFAKTTMTPKNHPCKVKNGVKVCAQKAGTVIKAPIWGSIA
jgi:hypothetical protein